MNGWNSLKNGRPHLKKSPHETLKAARPLLRDLGSAVRLPVWVIADNIRSIHNVGSLFRTCDAVGVEKLILCGITPHPPRPEISKTALGAEQSVPWEYHEDIFTVLEFLKDSGIPVTVLEHTDNSRDFQKAEYSFPLALVIGSETEGIGEGVLAYADQAVEIPMAGVKQSLNVSVACGVMLYELLRRDTD